MPFAPQIEELAPDDRIAGAAVARLIHAEWGAPAGAELGESEAWRDARLETGGETIFVARAGERTLGCVGVRRDDLEGYEPLGPWLACLVVAPGARAKGIGARLVRASERWAAARKRSALYTYTLTPEFFRKLGWRQFGAISLHEKAFALMRADLEIGAG